MSRSGYYDDGDDQWRWIMWRGAVASAFRGARGQSFLREAASALDAMPVKELASESLVTDDGSFCLLGAVGAARGVDIGALDPDDMETVSSAFGVSGAMAREIVFMNDEGSCDPETPAKRWHRMRRWLDDVIKDEVK